MTPSPRTVKTLTIGHDHNAEPPDSVPGGWKPVSFGSRHHNFEHPDRYRLDRPQGLGLRRKLCVGLAFWLSYYEHGLCRWSLRGEAPRCPWDSVDTAGLLIWTGTPSALHAKTFQARATQARYFLKAYTDWCNGHCYWFSLDDEGEVSHSCGGLIGTEQLGEAINEALQEGDTVVAEGEAACLAHSLGLKATLRQFAGRQP